MFINIVRWRVPKENRGKHNELWSEMMDYQKSHPEKVYYTSARFFTNTENGLSEENWMFLDEYKGSEDYNRWLAAVREDTEIAKIMGEWRPKWDALIVPGSRKGEIWTEDEKLKLEFE